MKISLGSDHAGFHYKEKVKELLDSGNSVGQVSRETKIRRDEIRRIKKAKDKEKE